MDKIKLYITTHPNANMLNDALMSVESIDVIKKQKIINALEYLTSTVQDMEHKHKQIGDEMLEQHIEELKDKKIHYMSEITDITGIDLSTHTCIDALEVALKTKTYKEAAHVIDHVVDLKDIKRELSILEIIRNY